MIFKAKLVYYNQSDKSLHFGSDIFINENLMTSFCVDPTYNKNPKPNDMGTVYLVNTVVDNQAYPLRVVSGYLDKLKRDLSE